MVTKVMETYKYLCILVNDIRAVLIPPSRSTAASLWSVLHLGRFLDGPAVKPYCNISYCFMKE